MGRKKLVGRKKKLEKIILKIDRVVLEKMKNRLMIKKVVGMGGGGIIDEFAVIRLRKERD